MSLPKTACTALPAAPPPPPPSPLVCVQGLSIRLPTPQGPIHPVRGIGFHIARGEVLGLVGESGCGKSLSAMALAGLLPEGATIAAKTLRIGSRDMLAARRPAWESLRRDLIGFVFQNPMKALNPRLLIGHQLDEALAQDDRSTLATRYSRQIALLEQVGVDRAAERLRQYPHELSGGLAQRVVIALALARRPALLIADEPTTALDLGVQAQILDLLDRLRREMQLAVLLVTHDLDVIRDRADRLAVMYAGAIVEEGPTAPLLAAPAHPYTAALMAAMPSNAAGGRGRLQGLEGVPPVIADQPDCCPLAPRCPRLGALCRTSPEPALQAFGQAAAARRAACLRLDAADRAADLPGGGALAPETPAETPPETPATEPAGEPAASPTSPSLPQPDGTAIIAGQGLWRRFGKPGLWRRAGAAPILAARDVSLAVGRGESVGIVGESGSGKSTLARMLMGLEQPDQGQVLFDGQPVTGLDGPGRARWRRDVQFVFQDNGAALDPRYAIGASIAEPLIAAGQPRAKALARAESLLAEVGLAAEMAARRPHQLSGGQRQRVGIARALALDPRLIIADEPVSALDVSIQAVILNLLNRLRAERGMSYLVISHDLGVIRYICTRIAVIYRGEIVETGPTEALLAAPRHPYTRALLAALPGRQGRAAPAPLPSQPERSDAHSA